jgi:hypothetical protein
MKGALTIIPVGTAAVTRKELTAAPRLEDLQSGVGGDIETVPHFNRYQGEPCVAFCNEAGKLDGLPVNHRATAHWYAIAGRVADVLVGPVVIVTGDKQLMRKL